jgi:sulfite reductase (ferredoxin)
MLADSETSSDPYYQVWKRANILDQKQEGYASIGIKIRLGDFTTDKARKLAELIKNHANDEIRLTIGQNILIRDVKKESLPYFYLQLQSMDLADPGYDSTTDITACPGTDTCNLGIASSTGMARVLEQTLKYEFPNYAYCKDLSIKISGCMNSCGQHSIADIGFYGMSMKMGKLTLPAFQVLLGGSNLENGQGRFADKVIKIPSKRGPEALRYLLRDFEDGKQDQEIFTAYYLRQGKEYFYQLLKPLADLSSTEKDIMIDWGHSEEYIKAIGVGECAGVVIDLVGTLLFESEEKLENAQNAFNHKKWADSIYHSYAALINTAKAVLIGENLKTNTHAGIISDFDQYFVESGLLPLGQKFADLIYQIKENAPSEEFAGNYLEEARTFFDLIDSLRTNSLKDESPS